MILTPVAGAVELGAKIKFPIDILEYETPGNNNAYPTIDFDVYTYGEDCSHIPPPVALETPSNLVANGTTGELTFDADANVNSNTVFVYAGTVLVHTQTNFTSGDVINFDAPGAYTVKVRSIGTTLVDGTLFLDSDYSESTEWVTGDFPEPGESNICRALTFPGQNEGANAVFMTWETLENGDIRVTMNDVAGNKATFRNTGLNANNFFIGGVATANGSTLVQTSASGNVCTITPRAGVVIPKGLNIRYTGNVEYRTDGGTSPNNNLAVNATFNFLYGATACPASALDPLAAPENIEIEGDGTITFDAVENAVSYQAFISIGTELITSQALTTNSGKINFSFPGTFQVTIVAYPDATLGEYIDSNPSVVVNWTPDFQAMTTVSPSVYCDFKVKPTNGNNAPAADDIDVTYWSWTTDAEGQLVISIDRAEHEEYTPTAAFRADGMEVANFRVNGLRGDLILEKVGGNTGKTQTFRAKAGMSLLPGVQITYGEGSTGAERQIEYLLVTGGNPFPGEGRGNIADLWPNTRLFPEPYIYGSNCSGEATMLDAPEEVTVEENAVSFAAVEGAAAYKLFVYDADGVNVHTQADFETGDAIDYTVPGRYTVKVQAIGNAGAFLNSLPSAADEWVLRAALGTPVNLEIDTENKLYFDEVPSAVTYTIFVLENEDDDVADAVLTLDDFAIGSLVDDLEAEIEYGTYFVKVQAIGDGDVILDSELSEAYEWNYAEGYVCNLLLTHPLVAGSDDITFIQRTPGHADFGNPVTTAPYFAPGWAPNPNFTFAVEDNVANIHLGAATADQWQAQFRLIIQPDIILDPAETYTIKATVKTSNATPVFAKVFSDNDNNSFNFIPLETLNAPEGKTFVLKNVAVPANLTKVFQFLFAFGGNPADVDIEISDIVICGDEGTVPAITCSEIAVVDESETGQGATATIPVTKGSYDVASIVLVDAEDNEVTLPYSQEDEYVIKGLEGETEYTFSVYAIDAAGNQSELCTDAITFTTTVVVNPAIVCDEVGIKEDSETQESAIVIVPVTAGTFEIASIVLVETADKLENITLPYSAENEYIIEGLSPETNYTFDVKAVDAEGNESEICAVSLTTPAGIASITVDENIVNEQYFTIDGRQVAVPTTGIYIVKKTLKDDSIITEKKLVK